MTPELLENLFRCGNLAEALVWFLFSVRYGLKAKRTVRVTGRWFGFGSAVFAIFGVSDLVEIQTGGWWKPWWLLTWKGICVLGLVVFVWRVRSRH